MANYKQVGYGSQGSDVKTLQQMLNNNGYKLDVDGIFGSKTQAAVKDYQKNNNLAVDGIVGVNTWGALTKGTNISGSNSGSSTAIAGTTGPSSNGTNVASNSYQYKPYEESDLVKQAQAMIQQQIALKPGEYTSPWQAQLDDAIKKILNREKFSYDLNGDALYQQYKDKYVQQGQQAMMDTMGQAAAMTGGYGNSYAQTVGQQVYQGHLQDLNDMIPELYQMALSKYQSEGQELIDQYGMLADQEQQDYGRYQDEVAAWNAEMDRLLNQYNTERDYDYGKWADDQNFQHQIDRDATADKQWQDAFDYQKERDQVADSQWQKEFDEAVRQFNRTSSGSGGSGGGGGGGGSDYYVDTGTGYDNGGLSSDQIKAIQRNLGVQVDGKWGPESQNAAKAMWGVTSAQDALAANNKMGTTNPGTSYDNGGVSSSDVKKIQQMLGVTADGKWGPESQNAAKAMWGVTSAKDALSKMNGGGGSKLTYSDVALTAEQMRKKGASKNDIYQYISSVVNSPNYKPTNSVSQDLAELRSGYVGTGR